MSDIIEVLVTLPFSEEIIKRLENVSPRLKFRQIRASRVEEIPPETWAIVDVLYTDKLLPSPEQSPSLRWIQLHLAGVSHILEMPVLQRPNLMVTSLSGVSASKVAEYVVMMLLALGLRLPDLLSSQRKADWPSDRLERFKPLELRDSTVGIIGYGSIGRQVSRLLQPFRAKVLAVKRDVLHPADTGYTPDGWGDLDADLVWRLYPVEALRSMVKECDFVVVALPLTPATRGIVGASVFDAMKPGAYLIDVSRGGVVEHAALVDVLKEHKIAGAALDVFPKEPLATDSPLWKLPNVIITPHVAGITPHYDERAVELFIENLRRFLAGETLLNLYQPELGY